MRLILTTIITVLLVSCSVKYKSTHNNYKKFNKDVKYCLKKSCKDKTKSVLHNFSIISSALAYGGGGSGSSGGDLLKNKVFYENFNLCLNERGYTKDKNGIFEISNLTCN